MKKMIDQYVDYNLWANETLAAFLKGFPRGLLNKEVTNSFPSLRKTVYHIYDAETIWLMYLRGEKADGWPSEELEDDIPIEFFLLRSRELSSYVKSLDKQALRTPITYVDFDGRSYADTAAQMIQHVVNHSTFHRGQLDMMLRQLGETQVPYTDFNVYLRSSV